MDCLGQLLLEKAFDCLYEPLKVHIGYIFCSKRKFQDVEIKLKELEGAENRVKNDVTSAKNKAEHIHQDVEEWLVDVASCYQFANRLIMRYKEKENARCFLGCCPDLKSRYKLSKEAVEQLKVIAQLYEKSSNFTSVSFDAPPNGFGVVSKDYMDFESRSAGLEQLMEALSDVEVDTIGVHGMGGVGKTTLVKEASVRAKKLNLFDKVLIVTVSWKADIGKIQGEIADKLGLEFREQSDSGRADRLCDRLKEFKRLLVVLDDLWSGLDLEKVGIPHGDAHKGCKLLLTSRSIDVLYGYMNAQKIVKVGTLQRKEAWKLFKKVAGQRVEGPDLKDTADKIATKCGGLPIAIVTIAKALKEKGLEEWKNAFRELQRSASENNTDIPNDAYRSIEFSYEQLQGYDLKSVFLLCGYMGGYHIIDLVKYSVGLGLFPRVSSMEEIRTRVCALVCKLEACSLLLSRPKHDQFALHDVVRDVAISIVSKDTQIFVMRENVGPKLFPDVNTLKNCTAITLFDVVISNLPKELKCPKLQFFHIFNKNPSLDIPEEFFRQMVELRVVDLTNMIIKSLPTSLLHLANLQTLCLDHSILGDISGIGELKSLEVLSFLWSEIQQLPEEIGQLTNLKLLDLDHCSKLGVIPPDVLSGLTQLEELYMNDSFKNWEYEGVAENRRQNATLAELKHLPLLTTFEAHIRDEQLIPKGLFTENLVRYNIFIGDEWVWNDGCGYSRMLKLKHDIDHPVDDGVLVLLKKAEELYLDEYKGIGSIFCRLHKEHFPQLKYLHIQNNSEIEYMVDSSADTMHSGSKSFGVFPMLESLSLCNVIELKKIFKGNCLTSSFRKLRTVKVEKCKRLRSLFPWCISKENLTQLEEIVVIDCMSISEIFGDEECEEDEIREEIDGFKYLQLRCLTLKHLPALVSFCSKQSLPSTSQSSRTESVPLLDEKFQFPRLETLELVSLRIEKIWRMPESSSSFKELAKLIIDGCEYLEFVLSSSMVCRLEHLKQLEISNCKKMRQIVFAEEPNCHKTTLFPQLVILKMDNLQNLTSFYSGDCAEFPSLEHLLIRKCPQFKELIGVQPRDTDLVRIAQTNYVKTDDGFCPVDEALFDGKIQAPKLKELILSSLEIAKLFPDEPLTTGFSVQRLARLILENCNTMRYLFPSYVVQSLTRLAKLEIRDCSNMESIVAAASGLGKTAKKTIEIKFPKLDDLKLENLSSLSRFCDGDRIDLPRLKKLNLKNCPDMNCFITDSKSSRGPNATAPLFDEKVGFPTLENLTISHMDNITEIWQNRLHPGSFDRLSCLKVEYCAKLLSIFPSTMLSARRELEKVKILNCASVRVISEREAANVAELTVTNLELRELPELQGFYSGNHHNRWPFIKKIICSLDCEKMIPFVLRSHGEMDPENRPVIQIV
ncbi:PREDICTED: probable disease resistance protein At4g27220 [Tarenaya hassleriana]|uniref:probable disease resistance protein At4g27220 n=1 Tax=Tarenaya hassleriana TaxID=28532 RepID=UPI00053C5973|nr:PREDICTED: probable disease resistance protein At4g27220 [Tarenaya hassleriana]XP_010546650.1 PREDICTED: probable disease resistance protein At4g27220 [Tarenaya hassleriana]XP_010546651.1 PREDICTED: probable disease resistance protein At4g27220 [Tarenaya hassleriana]XP_010546652.1 PREDICTED: probable disease resistance protein At4g27220 [Tarenaya hassleriana]XP_010546653.1 PREDICTED: probable disease resistance protein At4g27220 [Tarenaya hassleriana]XP_010546654.1 PREDICTED: probable disea